MRVDFGSPSSPSWPAPQSGPPFGERRVRTFTALAGELGGPRAAPPPPVQPAAGTSPFAAMLARAADADRAADAVIAAAARGRTFTPAQLLALQATVSRGTQTVEVVSRAVDRLVGTVKQSLGTQV